MRTSNHAPKLFERLGAKVTKLFCLVDGNFPNHHPDPSKLANLEDIIQAVKDTNADMGFAFDGDGDRDALIKFLYSIARECFTCNHNLKTIVLRWIMRTSNHHPRSSRFAISSVID
jgi:phosphoglucomutase